LLIGVYVDVKILKNHSDAVIPTYAKPGDAGMDLVAVEVKFTDDYVEYDTGLSMEIPVGYVGLIFPRSSISKYDLSLCNHVGVIDSSYRGSIKLRFKKYIRPDENTFSVYYVGDKIGQIIIIPYPQIEFKEVTDLSDTERGDGGFGSSGV